ncbi:MAG: leucyl/phenylalanyl-tRNA--protein transferase [Synechococcaceae cyanobacterium]|nr:leucyl/phenylalanyl-tRNA--protein transferase [Synechococcaceae cyanobacterium]
MGAYAEGWFPMAEQLPDGEHRPLQLYRSRERALLPLDGSLHCPRSLRRVLQAGCVQLSLNRAFSAVLRVCANRSDTWISPELIDLYERLHAAGLAHSVEAWQNDGLAAGLLAIAIGRCWIGESMAHLRPNAGNVLLVKLAAALEWGGFALFDVQLSSPHLRRFGCLTVSDTAYLARLRRARSQPARLQLGGDRIESRSWPPRMRE